MAEQDSEQNKSEEPTPFKLRRAREKGTVARGTDIGYFAVLATLAGFLVIAGSSLASQLALLMRRSLSLGIPNASDPQQAAALAAASYWPALLPVLLIGGTAVAFVIFVEILQLRGLIFSTQPLKPDFSRINPAKGLKRIFSLRTLKEAFKNIFKMTAYSVVAFLVIRSVAAASGRSSSDASGLATAMESGGMRLLFWFMFVALFVLAIDQIIVRREFLKQMRMSRHELTREHKEREGEPRLKQKRKQLHAEFAKQSKGLGQLPGSDMLVVNPEHVAVALAYDVAQMDAPKVVVKARNQRALELKRQAFRQGIPIFEMRPLARRLYDEVEAGQQIREDHFRAVADLYLKLHRSRQKPDHVRQNAPQ
jgi:flagellar biosynthetic protein FlhB